MYSLENIWRTNTEERMYFLEIKHSKENVFPREYLEKTEERMYFIDIEWVAFKRACIS